MADREQFYEVFCGIDVGKENHHACALDGAGRPGHVPGTIRSRTRRRGRVVGRLIAWSPPRRAARQPLMPVSATPWTR